MANNPILIRLRNAEGVNLRECSARDLLDVARLTFGCSSLYQLAQLLDLSPQTVDGWYRRNRMTDVARGSVRRFISTEHGQKRDQKTVSGTSR